MVEPLHPGLAFTLRRIVKAHEDPSRCRFVCRPDAGEVPHAPYIMGSTRIWCFTHRTYWCEGGKA